MRVAFAEARGRSLLELSFAWLASCDVIPSIIAGASRPEQVVDNVAAVEWQLTGDEVAEIVTDPLFRDVVAELAPERLAATERALERASQPIAGR